jgi:hypothetical protein
MQGLEDEPDLKRGSGGLRDLQRAVWANTHASVHPRSFRQASLVEAHRFLWLVRCHLHLLAGRAEGRLRSSFQPGITRRLGLDAAHKFAGTRLLDLVDYHRRNVLAAVGVTPPWRLGPKSEWPPQMTDVHGPTIQRKNMMTDKKPTCRVVRAGLEFHGKQAMANAPAPKESIGTPYAATTR